MGGGYYQVRLMTRQEHFVCQICLYLTYMFCVLFCMISHTTIERNTTMKQIDTGLINSPKKHEYGSNPLALKTQYSAGQFGDVYRFMKHAAVNHLQS